MRPLTGLTVLVTRPRRQGAALARRLQAEGARTICAPAIKTIPPRSWGPLDTALGRLNSYDALVFTSVNGVESFLSRAAAVLGGRPSRPRRLYAIGPGTAKALADEGWRSAAVPAVHEGEALARHFGRIRGWRVLLPRAEKAREALPARLRSGGAAVHVVPAYRTVPDRAGTARLRRVVAAGTADWVTFTSASTVENFWKAAGGAAAGTFFRKARAASIGPITSAALRTRGVTPAVEAERFTASGLVRALAAHCRPESDAVLRRTLVRALRAAGRQMRRRFLTTKVSYKGRGNPVTDADHAAEQAILDVVLQRFPGHDFITEERAPRASGADYAWVIDPIDGTVNYAHGFPHSCASVAVVRRGEAVAAGILDPFRRELFLAERGKGATLNGRPIKVGPAMRLRDALLITGFAYDRHERAAVYARIVRRFLERAQDLRRSGSAALDLAWLAAGRVDGFWEFHLNPWDVAAGRLLVEEAGGKVTDFSSRPWRDVMTWGRQTLATNGRIHGAMVAVIRKFGNQ